MDFLKKIAFYMGLVLGVITTATAGAVILTYLFTGKLPVVKVTGEKADLGLFAPEEVVTLIRSQVEKTQSSAEPIDLEGGWGNES